MFALPEMSSDENLTKIGFSIKQRALIMKVLQMRLDHNVSLLEVWCWQSEGKNKHQEYLMICAEVLLRQPFQEPFANKLYECRKFLDKYELNRGTLLTIGANAYLIDNGYPEEHFSIKIEV